MTLEDRRVDREVQHDDGRKNLPTLPASKLAPPLQRLLFLSLGVTESSRSDMSLLVCELHQRMGQGVLLYDASHFL